MKQVEGPAPVLVVALDHDFNGLKLWVDRPARRYAVRYRASFSAAAQRIYDFHHICCLSMRNFLQQVIARFNSSSLIHSFVVP